MGRSSFTIAGMMTVIALVGLGLASLRYPTPLRASIAYSLCLVILWTAALIGSARPGRARVSRLGIAASGLAYLHFAFAGHDPAPPPLITTALLARLADRMPGGGEPLEHVSFGVRYRSTNSFVSRAVGGGFDRYAFGQIGHCFGALIVGLIGGFVASMLARGERIG